MYDFQSLNVHIGLTPQTISKYREIGGMLYMKSGLKFIILRIQAQFSEIKAILKPRFWEEIPLLCQEIYNTMQIFLMGDIVGTHT